jgi:prepilin-type N-terminal cleavage/methylation domain-containing protein
MKSKKGGFTLIELLVVITIIMVLVALIFPAGTGVFRMAQEARCQNNLNQLGQITVAYCQSRDGRFPPPCDRFALAKSGSYTSGWVLGGTTSPATTTWVVSLGIFYKEKLVGDLSVFWCPIHFEQYNIFQPYANQLFWRTADPTHQNYWRLWTSYMMNGNVYYDPSGGAVPTESRLSSEFTANHFLFIEEHEKVGFFDDGAMNGTSADKLADRHEGFGFIACMDGHVIKMKPTDFDATKTPGQKKYYWTPR